MTSLSSAEARSIVRQYYTQLATTDDLDTLQQAVVILSTALITHMDWYDVIRLAQTLAPGVNHVQRSQV